MASIALYYPASSPFHPSAYDTDGVGDSEAALILASRALWCDSFAAARNESLRHATGDWAFWLDADERLDATNRQRLLEVFGRLGRENAGYMMKQHSAGAAGR
jgi:hypothetical protein